MTQPPDRVLEPSPVPSDDRPGQRIVPLFLLLGLGHLALVWRLGAWTPASEATRAAALLTFGAALALGSLGLRRGYPHDRLGACNAVTQLRAALACCLVLPILDPGLMAALRLDWAVVALALLTLALDGLDGWLARRSGLASSFGARFDMEVDAVFALLLALLVLRLDKAGAWVLLLGLARYGFVLAQAALPWLRGPLPERLSRKAVCVLQIAVLILLLAPPVAPPLSTLLAAVATLALIWSFARDIRWLAARR